ncbi:MAG: hypothetical protein AB7O38_03880 [Pirellulaceae bacterium]
MSDSRIEPPRQVATVRFVARLGPERLLSHRLSGSSMTNTIISTTPKKTKKANWYLRSVVSGLAMSCFRCFSWASQTTSFPGLLRELAAAARAVGA